MPAKKKSTAVSKFNSAVSRSPKMLTQGQQFDRDGRYEQRMVSQAVSKAAKKITKRSK